jgi:hypothetical protein
MTVNDVALLAILSVLVVLLVNHYLRRRFFSKNFRITAIAGGWFWLLYSCFGEEVSEFVLGIAPSDAPIHGRMAGDLIRLMERGEWEGIWSGFGPGNHAYHVYLALTSFIFGATEVTWIAINGLVAFWGGLMLVRHLGIMFPAGKRRNLALLFILFCPSVVFWSSTNLKEGLMYWSICCVFSSTFPTKVGSRMFTGPLMIVGSIVGGLMRPHIMTGWVTAVVSVNFLRRGQIGYAVVLVFAIPLLLIATQQLTGAALEVDSAMEKVESQYKLMSQIKGGSDIEYGNEGPIPVASGLVSIFFRPLPWEIRSIRFVFAIIETWTITLLAIGVWLKMHKEERRDIFRFPEIQAALIALAWGAFLLSYFPNTGLLMRQRVQMVPALLILTFTPILYRAWMKERLRRPQRLTRPDFASPPVWLKSHNVKLANKYTPGS